MKDLSFEVLILAGAIVWAGYAIDVKVTVNVSDKPIVSNVEKVGDMKNIILPTGRNN